MKHPGGFAKRHQALHKLLEAWGVEQSRGMELMRALIGSARMLEVMADHGLQKTGLSLPRLRLLLWLAVEEQGGNPAGISPSVLSHYQHISKNTVSALLASLEEQGLVERTISQEDKRSFNIRLTKAGRERIRAALPRHGEYINEVLAELTVEEQKTLLKLLQKLQQALRQQLADKKLESYVHRHMEQAKES